MSSQAYADRMGQSISRTGLAEPVNATFGENKVSVLIRVKNGVDHKWNDLIKNVLLATDHFDKEAFAWQSHICRTYFLRKVGAEKKMVFGWSITITSQDLSFALDEVVRVMNGGDPEPKKTQGNFEVDEFPLVGATGERNVPGASGKGASTIGGKSSFRPPVR